MLLSASLKFYRQAGGDISIPLLTKLGKSYYQKHLSHEKVPEKPVN